MSIDEGSPPQQQGQLGVPGGPPPPLDLGRGRGNHNGRGVMVTVVSLGALYGAADLLDQPVEDGVL